MTGDGSGGKPGKAGVDAFDAATEADDDRVLRRFGGSVDGGPDAPGDGGSDTVVIVDDADAAPRRRLGGPRTAFRGGGFGR
jgi:hypothetical protein